MVRCSTPTEVFTPDSVNYYPGELYLSAQSSTGQITQKLLFADASTALLSVCTDKGQEILFTGDDWAAGTTFAIEQNTIVATHPSGEIISIGFAPDAKVSCNETGIATPKHCATMARINWPTSVPAKSSTACKA